METKIVIQKSNKTITNVFMADLTPAEVASIEYIKPVCLGRQLFF